MKQQIMKQQNLNVSTKCTKSPLVIACNHGNKCRNAPTDLGYYLAGLIEGDGCFSRNKLEIIYHIKDLSAAYRLRDLLGYGAVYKHSSRKAVRFTISSKAGLSRVVNLCNGKFVTDSKVNQLIRHNYEIKLDLAILPPSGVLSLNNSWLAGFIDADGSLGIFLASSKTHTLRRSVRLEVKFSQKDHNILYLIGCLFGSKKYYVDKKKIGRLTITDQEYLKEMICYLDMYHLQTEKYNQYCLFKCCYYFIKAKNHLSAAGLEQVKVFKKTLQSFSNKIEKN